MSATTKPQFVDASGRGQTSGFKVPYPARMYAYTEEEIAAVVNVLRGTRTLSQGEYQATFENDFAAFVGTSHAYAVSSGSAALKLTAQLCRLEPGDEVIIPAYTFCASAIPFGATGARIVWADIDPSTRTISAEDVANKITPRTKVILAVHLLGMPCDMDRIMELARPHGIKVVEDCAQAPGATYKGRRVGSIGDFACFSFNSAKNLTTLGEGGMLVVNNDQDAAAVTGLRHNGIRAYPAGRPRYWVPAMSNVDLDVEGQWPGKSCLTEAQCALGSALLTRLDTISQTLRAQFESLRDMLKPLGCIKFQDVPSGRGFVAHCCIAGLEGAGVSRDEFMDVMTREYGIQLIVQYRPLYQFPLFQKMGFGQADCPQLENYWSNSFSYPWWCGVPEETLDYLAECTKKALEKSPKE
jgi:dTDP-4-amino-4,6-dideoxygalactose transaminase